MRDAAALALLGLLLALWFYPATFRGAVPYTEDVIGAHYAARASLYRLAHGGGFSLWDPLPGLGMPRLGEVEYGHLSPVSILFYLVPTPTAMRFYPILVYGLLAAFTYGVYRVRGVGTLAALFGTTSWLSCGVLLSFIDYFPVMETLVWMPAALLAWEMLARTGRGRWAALGAAAVASIFLGGHAQFIALNLLLIALWMGGTLWEARADRPRCWQLLVGGCGMLLAGFLVGTLQLLPAVEMAAASLRAAETVGFTEAYRAAPWEVTAYLMREVHFFLRLPGMQYATPFPYPNVPGVSVLTLGIALAALVSRPRPLFMGGVALLFLLGMLGRAGGITPLLSAVVPYFKVLRAPYRMLLPGTFALSWLAALGMHRWLQGAGRRRQAGAVAAVAWIVVSAAWLKSGSVPWAMPSTLPTSPVVGAAAPRLAVELSCPLFVVNSGLMAGIPSLVCVQPIFPRNYFEALFASQIGPLEQHPQQVDLAANKCLIPLAHPNLPLLQAFGLRTIVACRDGRESAVVLDRALPRFFAVSRVRVLASSQNRWLMAASSEWDARSEALVEAPVAGLPEAASRPETIQVRSDGPDHQSLSVDGPGGLLVTSEDMFPGWRVQVDGHAAEPLQVDLALRGVVVPPGAHSIQWDYRPGWLPAALACAAAGCLLAAALCFVNAPPSGPGC